MKQNNLPNSNSNKTIPTVIMDISLYNAAVTFTNKTNITSFFNNTNTQKDQDYYTRKTRGKNNILHLSLQHENFKFTIHAATKFPQLINEVNDDGNNPVHIAVETGNVEIVDLIVKCYQNYDHVYDNVGVPWRVKNKDGSTPLHLALVYGNIKVASFMVHLDPTLARLCNDFMETPLHLAVRHRVNEDRKLVGAVLKAAASKLGSDYIITGCNFGKDSMPIVELLLEKDPSLSSWCDAKGLTPILVAATLDPPYVPAMEAMLHHCPDSAEVRDHSGRTLLHLLTKLSETDYEKLFKFSGVKALKNKQDNAGNTPAHIAAKNGDIDMILTLIKSSANLAIKNKDGVSAAYLIQQRSEDFQNLVQIKAEKIASSLSELHSQSDSGQRSQPRFTALRNIQWQKNPIEVINQRSQFGNILHANLTAKPENVETQEFKKLFEQVLEMSPSLICQLNNAGQTPLHIIAHKYPSLIDKPFLDKVASSFERLQEADSIEGLCYEFPWKVKDINGNTPLHLALDHLKWRSWVVKVMLHYPELAYEPNINGEMPLHVCIRRVCDPDLNTQSSNKNVKDKGKKDKEQDKKDKEQDKKDREQDKKEMIHNLCYITLANHGAINKTDKFGLTPLLRAAQAKELECFSILLQQHGVSHHWDGITNCDLKLTYPGDPNGNTFWHHLADMQLTGGQNDESILKMWEGTCYHARNALMHRNKGGKTPFHVAIESGNFRVANMFSKTLASSLYHKWKVPDLEYIKMGDQDENTPLHVSAGRSHLPNARGFIERVASIRELTMVKNKEGCAPIHLAVLKKDFEFANVMFDVIQDDKTILRQLLLLDDKDHNTPLHLSMLKNEPMFCDLIFDQGLLAECMDEILVKSNSSGDTPLHLAVLKGDIELASKFIDRAIEKDRIQAILEKRNKEGNTALHLAALKGDHEMADIIVKRATKVNSTRENLALARILINTQDSLSVKKRDMKLLMSVNKSSTHRILEKCNKEGDTPLHLALRKHDFVLAKMLMEYAVEDSCINEILEIPNNKDETPGGLIGSAERPTEEFEKFFWSEPKVVEAMLGIRSVSGVPTKMIKEYTNTIGVIAALLATITFTAGFTVPGGLNSANGTPLLMTKVAFQAFMVSDILAMCLSVMVLFCLMWIMTISNEKYQVVLLDVTVFLLQGAFYATLLAFMTGLYVTVFPILPWIAVFACVLCSLLILLMHKRLIIKLVPSFIRTYVYFQRAYSPLRKFCGHLPCCCHNNDRNNGEGSERSSRVNRQREDAQTVVNMDEID